MLVVLIHFLAYVLPFFFIKVKKILFLVFDCEIHSKVELITINITANGEIVEKILSNFI